MKSSTLSEDLRQLVDAADESGLCFGDFVEISGKRAFGVVFLLLALPSALPLPATGFSTPFGIAMLVLSFQLIAGRKDLWLPKRVLNIRVPLKFAKKMVSGLIWILSKFEFFVKPRMAWMNSRSGHVLTGILIASLALVMQTPIPLTNTLPAAVIFCIALAMIEEDGLLGFLSMLLAIVVVAAYVALLALFFIGGMELIQQIIGKIRG